MLERIPPHSIDAERAVLGSMILDDSMIETIDGMIIPEDFYLEANRKTFKAIVQNHKKGPVDIILLGNILGELKQLESVGGMAHLSSLVDDIPSAANIVYYAGIVKENSLRRKLLATAYEITTMSFSSDKIADIIEKSQKNIMAINSQTGSDGLVSAKEVARATISEIEARSKSGLIVGLSTGLRDVDEITGGLHKGELTIIAGRPAMGKSCLAVNIAHAAGLRGEASLINSIEMPNETLMIRMLSSMAKVESRNLRRGFIRDVEWPHLVNACSTIADAQIFFDDSPNITPAELRQRARKAKHDHDIKLLVLDYMQIMQTTHGRKDTREQEVSEISRTLKGIARELNIPVIGVSQLNRQVDQRSDKRPMMSDLRESGAIEQDADLILFIYRDEVYNKAEDNPEKGIAEIIIGKNRHGDTPVIKTVFQAKYQQFVDFQSSENAPWRKYDRARSGND